MKNLLRSLLLLFLLFSAACSTLTTGPVRVKYPNAVSTEAREEFNAAEKSFEAKNYAASKSLYKNFLQKYPYNELSDKSEFRLGQIAMLDQNLPQAIQIFKALIQKSPDGAIRSKSGVKLGLSYYRQNEYGPALAAFDAVQANALDEREKAKLASFALASAQALQEDLNKKSYYYLILFDLYESLPESEITSKFGSETPAKSDVVAKFKEWVSGATPIEALDRRIPKYEGKSRASYVEFKLGKSYYESKNNPKAEQALKRFLSKNPNHEFAQDATRILASLGGGGAVTKQKSNAIAVGVILPLSGKYEQYGNNALKGMECAASIKPECHGVSNIRLIVKDSGGDPEKAAQLVDELVQKEKVVAIVGPLPSSEVEAAVKKAQENGVTLLALSQKKGVPALGENVFRFSLTPTAQVRALLEYMTKRQGIKNFAVFYPNNNYGQEFLGEFQKEVSAFSAKIKAKKGFAPSRSDLSEDLRELKLSITELKAGEKPFDAIFIPDSYLTMGKVAPAFINAGLSEIVAFGTNAWNDSSLPQKIGSSLKKAFFVDIYFRDAEQAAVKSFVHDFQLAYTYPPSTLEAMGYDAIRILGQALASKKNPKKDEIKPALLQIHDYQGATGLKGFQESREAEVRPYILGVDGSGIKELK